MLKHVTLSVNRAETVALVGRSGAGKSTLLRLVNRLLTPSAGRVMVDGRDTREWDAIRLRRRIGYVIQEVGLFPHMTVEENVGGRAEARRLAGRPHRRAERVSCSSSSVFLPRIQRAAAARAVRRPAPARRASRARWRSIRRSC